MHGRVKVRTTAEQEAIKKKERAEKVKKYKACMSIIFKKREEESWDDELLLTTEKMLLQNPDIYTLWNIRREAFLNKDWAEDELKTLFERELTLTENCLRENPKSYSVWHQRWWIMNRTPEPNWSKELALCSKCLDLDQRNFHCWDYREFVVQQSKISDEEEFDFSTAKIMKDFSNYSSWHYRSRILSKMFSLNRFDDPAAKAAEELDLVMNATFTDPNDSSAWFYQRWLLDERESSSALWRAMIKDNRAVLVFERDTTPSGSFFVNGETSREIKGRWESRSEQKFSKLWVVMFDESLNRENAKSVSIKFDDKEYNLAFSEVNQAWVYKTPVSNERDNNEQQLREQLESYKELFKMEPNNKWALLTSVLLMKRIDFLGFEEEILRGLSELIKIDSIRSTYYKDLRSKFLLRFALKKLWADENELELRSQINLSDLNLTTIEENHYLAFFKEINLGANHLQNSIGKLWTLRSCEKLSLSSNGLKSLKQFPKLENLKVLSLRNNELASSEEILDLITTHSLEVLDLRENPVCENTDLIEQIHSQYPNLEVCTN